MNMSKIGQRIVMGACAWIAASAAAGNVWWVGGSSGAWTEPANWSGGQLPGAGDTAVFTNTAAVSYEVLEGAAATIDAAIVDADLLMTFEKTGPGALTFTATGATKFYMFKQRGGTVTLQNPDWTVERMTSMYGNFVQNGGRVTSSSAHTWNNTWCLGMLYSPFSTRGSSNVDVTINGGVFDSGSHDLQLGYDYVGIPDRFHVTGGGVMRCGGWFSVGRGSNSNAEFLVTDGTCESVATSSGGSGFIVGEGGGGYVRVGCKGVLSAPTVKLANGAAASGVLSIAKGGVVRTKSIFGANASSPRREVRLDGGTLEIGAQTQATNLTGLTALVVGPSGGRVDVAGRSYTLKGLSAGPSKADLVHRWSFNGDASDSVGGQPATLVGTAAYLGDGTGVRLPGGAKGTAYIDLGSDILPTSGTGITIELWATHQGLRAWSRILDFGVSGTDAIMMGWTYDTNINSDFVCIKGSDRQPPYNVGPDQRDKLRPYSLGTPYHIAMTFAKRADAEVWDVTCYKQDATTGRTLASFTFATKDWSPFTQQLTDCWLGHSHGGDPDAQADFDEVRIWRRALTEEELAANAVNGPDDALDSTLVKGGDGTLFLEPGAVPFVGGAHVLAGRLEAGSAGDSLLHRWSFNGDAVDAMTGVSATVDGGAAFVDGQCVLPGGVQSTGAIDLGGNVIPSSGTALTFELWATQLSLEEWSRIFTIGYSQGTSFFMSWAGSVDNGLDINRDVIGVCFYAPDAVTQQEVNHLARYELGTEYHIAVVMEPAAEANRWQMTVYKQSAVTGETLKKHTFTVAAGWSPFTQAKTHFYLGRSLNPDHDAHASYNEMRIWTSALTEEQLTANAVCGPDALPSFSPANFGADAAFTVDAGADLVIDPSSATVVRSLAGAGTVTCGPLTVSDAIEPGGAGTVGALSLTAVGAVTGCVRLDVAADGSCDALAFSGSLDARGLSLAWAAGAVLGPGPYTVARFAPGTSFTGPFASLPDGLSKITVNQTAGTVRLARIGLIIVVR